MAKYYAVRKGQHPGIYTTWPDAQKEVSGFSGAEYKSFKTKPEAEAYLTGSTNAVEAPRPAGMVIGYTDGGTRNTGNVKGGHVKSTDAAAWAYRLEIDGEVLSDSAGEWGATNNRMEIMALIKVLTALLDHNQEKADITLVLDSKYVLDAVNKGWLNGWARRGWKRSTGELMNAELWQQVYRLLPHFKKLSLLWTKGHADNQGNIFVDSLLNKTMDEMEKNGRPINARQQTDPESVEKQGAGSSDVSKAPTNAHTTVASTIPKNPVPKKPASNKRTAGSETKQSKEVAKSVSDIEKALGQLDLFKDQ